MKPNLPRPNPATGGATLTIDLTAIQANYRLLQKRVGSAICAAVVKADAYGLGAHQVASALASEGCQHFFVAHAQEGLELRRGLSRDTAIYVLNGLMIGAEDAFLEGDLVPVINSLHQLHRWSGVARARDRILPAVIQVDSGMSRLGLSPTEVLVLSADTRAFAGLSIDFVMSHLACADEEDHPANETQRIAFEHLSAMLPRAKRSLANSSGVFLGKSFHHDMVRPGAALYGINPTPGRPNPMRPVVTLAAPVIQTRRIDAGTAVGYGWAHVAAQPTLLATVALGYADGWQRQASAAAFFDGHRLPLVGRVSMDTIVLDISSIGDDRLAPGSMVEIIGSHQDVDSVAAQLGTIGYEVLTSLGDRFHRVFIS